MTQRKKGFSLIEVAIALVIFVIGALAVIRIFPTGLGLVEKSGNQQRASNLNRSLLAAVRQNDSVPDGIYNGDLSGWQFFDGAVSGFRKYNNTLPKSVRSTDLTNSALDRLQVIKGEKVVVQAGISNPFFFTRFSIASAPNIFREFVVQNVTVNNAGDLDFAQATRLSDDSAYVPVATDRIYVTYRYRTGGANPRIAGVDDEIAFDNGTNWVVSVPNVVASPVSVRVRQLVAPGVTFNAERARAGYIELLDANFDAGETLYVDYQTNWYWLTENFTVATPADETFGNAQFKQIELGVPFIKNRTSNRFAAVLVARQDGSPPDTEPTVFSAYFGNNGNDLSHIPAADDKFQLPPTTNAAQLRNVLREGKIAVDTNGLLEPQARVAYRTQDDWVRQLSVAARSYKPFTSVSAGERWRDYAQNGQNLYFHASEAGKAIKVTYAYGDPTALPSTDETRTELVTIGNEIMDVPSGVNLGADAPRVSRAVLTPPSGSVTAILSIKGESIHSRTAWLTNDRYEQVVQTSMRGAQ